MQSSLASDVRRLRWRCRRGMLELDQLLMGFLDQGYETLNAKECELFERLLDTQDPILSDWFMGRAQAPDLQLAALISRIIATVSAASQRDP